MNRNRILLTVVAATLLLAVLPVNAGAQGAPNYRITITNLTSGQIISPPVVVTHSANTYIFRAGEAASSQVAALAEDADSSGLLTALAGNPQVADFDIAEGPLLPGASVTLYLNGAGPWTRLTALGMLVTTNDAFFGLDSADVSGRPRSKVFSVPAYDAGSEVNSESCTYIPGPPCGNGGVRDTDGAEGFIYVHSGIHGIADLVAAEHDWRNPVARITVERSFN
ncbi:MAG: spondin domain-containing protein [Thermoanaerobaculia bacterium]